MNKKAYSYSLILPLVVLAIGALACAVPGIGAGGGGAGGECAAATVYDGGDGLQTIGGGVVTVGGGPVTGELNDLFQAENWTFCATAGQTVTIEVNSIGETDPRVKLIGPDGSVLAEDDDSGGGWNALIEGPLPVDGVYTIRVDVYAVGQYTVTVR